MTSKPYSEWTREQKDAHNLLRAESRERARFAVVGTEYEPHDSVTEHTAEQIKKILDGERPSSLWGRDRGFVEWTPQAERAKLASDIEVVLEEYRPYWPVTVRQIYYRLVGTVTDKSDDFSEKVTTVCGKMRRARMIPMDCIRDDGGAREEPLWWADEAEWIANSRLSAKQARLDRQAGQAQKLIIRCEAAGMVPQVARVADEWGVPVVSSGGTDSIAEKHNLGIEDYDQEKNEYGVHVLHIGDLDPNGIHIFIALSEDASAFPQVYSDGEAPDFTRIAVTPDQVERLELRKNPVKRQINKKGQDVTPAYPHDYTCQAEAIAPDELARIVRAAITDERETLTGYCFDQTAYDKVLAAEKRLQKSLLKRLKG
jgi:hypothetical protein